MNKNPGCHRSECPRNQSEEQLSLFEPVTNSEGHFETPSEAQSEAQSETQSETSIIVTECLNKPFDKSEKQKKKEQEKEAKLLARAIKQEKKALERRQHGRYYYTDDEAELLKSVKVLCDSKFLRKHQKEEKPKKCCGLCKRSEPEDEPEDMPSHDCAVIIELWEKHDEHCIKIEKDFSYVGQIYFPFCSLHMHPDMPGTELHKSMKSAHVNDLTMFRVDPTEERLYAYEHRILPSFVIECTSGSDDIESFDNAHTNYSERRQCSCKKKQY